MPAIDVMARSGETHGNAAKHVEGRERFGIIIVGF
jgi:hypothetical protein